ncbi:MAG TPA: hypothetical protein PLE19_15905 [Planctomycetota bacterium]|nr:hypothetical protein [Planctomycetota bacterium]HRR81586.1 hypothetical protein [Planctomycetota bacterium]HRT94861.1 hypothetical protein [Planctomycetota bacterium]
MRGHELFAPISTRTPFAKLLLREAALCDATGPTRRDALARHPFALFDERKRGAGPFRGVPDRVALIARRFP